MTDDQKSGPALRPVTLEGAIGEFEALLQEAAGYPRDAHGYPGKEMAERWYARERDANLWAQALIKRISPAQLDLIPWVPSVVSQFPARNWELRVRHLDRLSAALRNLRDELELLAPVPSAVKSIPFEPHPRRAEGWLERHGWQAIGTLLTITGVGVSLVVGLKWGPFK